MKVRKEVRTVEFGCRNYARMASISVPEFSSDVIRVKPLWTSSLKDCLLWAGDDKLDLRWFDSESVYNGSEVSRIKKSGVINLQVEIHYVSVQLDRDDKLDVLGVK